jgi:hypothetical protein
VLGFRERMGIGWYTKESYQLLKKNGWPANFEAVVSLPDFCYTRELKNDGREYFRRCGMSVK